MFESVKQQYLKYKNIFFAGSERSVLMKKNILLTLSLRIFTVIPSILLVPLTIDYVNPEQYGIWLTLSSILILMNLFDFGFSNGFRNRFAEARAANDDVLAGQLVSTTYFVISLIALTLLVTFEIININLDWCSLLHVSSAYSSDLRSCFAYLILFFCLSLITNILTSLLTADQKPSLASLLQAIGQVLSLLAIIALRVINGTGSIVELAIAYSGIPFLVFLLGTGYFFFCTNYNKLRPKITAIRVNHVKDLMTLGFKFFVITLCSMVIFQLMNIIITRELGALAVTQFNVANKYFNILYMPAIIILTPIWSAVTDAYVKQDIIWIKSIKKRLEKAWLYCVCVAALMVFLSMPFYHLWVGDKVYVSYYLSIMMALYILVQIIGNAYMYMINGTGKVVIQTIVYVVFAIISYPTFVYGARHLGLEGMLLVPIVFYFVQTLLGNIQLNMILKGDVHGLWAK